MLRLSLLILLMGFLHILLKQRLMKSLLNKENNYQCLEFEYEKAVEENARLKTGNALLEKSVEENMALYDITKDMRKELDEDTIFKLFRERIHDYIRLGDCLFLKENADLTQYKNYTSLPLSIENKPMGYLLASGIKEEDKEKFYILAHQFLSGVKGAFLFKKVQELTIVDSLTQIFNRRYFLERFHEEMVRSKKFKYNFSFLMVDIDHFKEINDHFGHLVGDAILREATKTMKENIRQVDFMGRFGGEELSIVITETDKQEALLAGERIRKAIELKNFRVYDEDLKITISIGLSAFPDDAKEAMALIDKADQALYQAKQSGRNKICVWKPP